MYEMQDERKPQDAPKVALTHQERMRREEAKKAIAADKDPMLAQINEGDLATPELRRLAAEFPQLMLPPDDPSRMSVPPEIVVRASLLLKQRDDNASQNSTAIIDESLRRREVRNSFGMILGYGDPAGTARIDLTGMRAPGTETAEEIRYGEMRARERREREWGEALAKIGGMTTDMIMALGGAMGQMGTAPRMQTSPSMMGMQGTRTMSPTEWNRPGSQMGTWWESLPTAAQQGLNVGARSTRLEGRVPVLTPTKPVSFDIVKRGKSATAKITNEAEINPVISESSSSTPSVAYPEQTTKHQRVMRDPQFKKWFGKSVVKNRTTGEPVVVYHGTSATTNFDVFKPSGGGASGPGIYTATLPTTASAYAKPDKWHRIEDEEAGPRVFPMYLRMEKPIHLKILPADAYKNEVRTKRLLSDYYDEFQPLISQVLRDNKMPYENKTKQELIDLFVSDESVEKAAARGQGTTLDYLTPYLRKNFGYDGVQVELRNEIFYVPFSSEQLKSINNPGTWGSKKPESIMGKIKMTRDRSDALA